MSCILRARAERSSVNRTMVQQGLARWYSEYGGQRSGLEQAERDAHSAPSRRLGDPASRWRPGTIDRQQRQGAARGNLFRTLLLATGVSVLVLVALYLLPRCSLARLWTLRHSCPSDRLPWNRYWLA